MKTNTIERYIMSLSFLSKTKYKANDWKRVFVKPCVIAGVGRVN